MTKKTIKPRYFPLDVIRLFACFAVIIVHIAATDISEGGYSRLPILEWLGVLGLGSLGRSAVPLFIMLSGALLLHHTRQKYGYYIIRKSVWILAVYLSAATGYTVFSISINDGLFNEGRMLADFLAGIGVPFFHLYFLLIILGLYLITPLLSGIKTLPTSTIVVGVVGLTVITNIDLLLRHFQQVTIGTLAIYGKFVAYIPYFVLGYLLVHRWKGYIKHGGWLAISSLLAIWVLAFLLTWQHGAWGGNLVFYYENVLVMALSIGLFGVLYQWGTRLEEKLSSSQKTILTSLAQQTLWVYLIHILILRILQSFVIFSPLQNWGFAPLKVIVLSIFVLIISFLITYLGNTIFRVFKGRAKVASTP